MADTSNPAQSATNLATQSYVVTRLTNYNQADGGSFVPPQLKGNTRVPFATNFKVASQTAGLGTTIFTLSWTDVTDANVIVDKYNIYVTNLLSPASAPVLVVSSQVSPATVEIRGSGVNNVTFYIQTQLASGFVTSLDASPTCGAKTISPALTPGQFTGNFPIVDSASLLYSASNSAVQGRFSLTGAATGTNVYTLPPNTGRLAATNAVQSWSAAQTFSALGTFNSGLTVSGGASIAGTTNVTGSLSSTAGFTTTDLVASSTLTFQHVAVYSTFTAGSALTFLCDATSGAMSANLPAASGQNGRVYIFKKVDSSANAVTVTAAGSDKIDGAGTKVLTAQYSTVGLHCDGTAWWIIFKF
jgi:hypothetical protein